MNDLSQKLNRKIYMNCSIIKFLLILKIKKIYNFDELCNTDTDTELNS